MNIINLQIILYKKTCMRFISFTTKLLFSKKGKKKILTYFHTDHELSTFFRRKCYHSNMNDVPCCHRPCCTNSAGSIRNKREDKSWKHLHRGISPAPLWVVPNAYCTVNAQLCNDIDPWQKSWGEVHPQETLCLWTCSYKYMIKSYKTSQ